MRLGTGSRNGINAAPPAQSGTVQGSITFYYPGSIEGQRAAQIIANNLKTIYPNPNLVSVMKS